MLFDQTVGTSEIHCCAETLDANTCCFVQPLLVINEARLPLRTSILMCCKKQFCRSNQKRLRDQSQIWNNHPTCKDLAAAKFAPGTLKSIRCWLSCKQFKNLRFVRNHCHYQNSMECAENFHWDWKIFVAVRCMDWLCTELQLNPAFWKAIGFSN